jgi:hypothetical protein
MKFKGLHLSFLPGDGAWVPVPRKVPAKTWMIVVATVALAVGMGFVLGGSTQEQGGPNDGAIVALDASMACGEVLANADSGEVTVYIWSKDLKSIRPVADWPLKMGSDDQTLELAPQPDASDPPGYCSKFHGSADWLRGGKVLHGWISSASDGTKHRNFDWKLGWQASIHLEPICCGANCQRP